VWVHSQQPIKAWDAAVPTPKATTAVTCPFILPYRNILLRIDPTAWIAPDEVVIGDLEIGADEADGFVVCARRSSLLCVLRVSFASFASRCFLCALCILR
jgi:hypothetical protein